MPLSKSTPVEMGEIHVTDQKTSVLTIPSIGTAVAVIIFDMQNRVGGIAHVVLPESTMNNDMNECLPGKYANLAVPVLLEQYLGVGGQKRTTIVRMVGGAQLFNFGGGGGNIMNIGARNASAIRAAMSRFGYAVEKADTGGNKNKTIRFVLATGQLYINVIGGGEYRL